MSRLFDFLSRLAGRVSELATNKLDAAKLPDAVNTALATAKASGEFDGVDGVSVTHEWDGTTLKVTSASGTSSVDLKGERGASGPQGDTGAQGPQGPAGKDGQQGHPGNGIASIVKSSSEGLLDTYTITYTDGTSSTFIVTNGSQGEQGIQGESGRDGHTPVITIVDGYWYVDNTNTGVLAVGPQGEDGPNGPQGITPHIGDNGNWFIGETDTEIPSRGEPGSTGPSGIHVGSEPPTDPTVHVWINPDSDNVFDELPAGPAGEDGGHYTPAVTQLEPGKLQFDWSASREDMPTVASQSVTLPAGPKGETGETGPQGDPGADGKSAYQYAQDGGYTGTEEDFAKKLATDLPSGDSDYILPIATADTLGGVKPTAKSDDMTQSVGVDESGGLWTAPASTGSNDWQLLKTISLDEDVSAISYNFEKAVNELYVIFKVRASNADGTASGGYANAALSTGGPCIQNQPMFYKSSNLSCCHVFKRPNMLCAEWRLYANATNGQTAAQRISGSITNAELSGFSVSLVDSTLFFKAGGVVEVWYR